MAGEEKGRRRILIASRWHIDDKSAQLLHLIEESGSVKTILASDAGEAGKSAELNDKQREKQIYDHDDE